MWPLETAIMKHVARKGRTSGTMEAARLESDLVRRCVAGERAAQEEFYAQYRRQVAANVYRVLGDNTDLDDLVQEVFVIAFRGMERFRGEARLSTWLYRICTNVALGRIRKKTRRPAHVLMEDPMSAATVDSVETPERELQRQQDRKRVYRLLESMAPKKRIVFYLHEIEGLHLKDIAYIVGANPVTIRTRLFYARREFYKRAAEEGEG